MKKKILLLGLCGMLFITTTIFTAPTIQASAATIISAQTNVIVAPQSYTITYYKSDVTVWYPNLNSVQTTYAYSEYYKDYGMASGILQLTNVVPNGSGYLAYYSGYMYCTTN